MYINDLTDELISNTFIYADDTMLFEVVENANVLAANLNGDLNRISHWSGKWFVAMNPSMCHGLVFSLERVKPLHPTLYLNSTCIEEVDKHTQLGLIFQSNMSWRCHIQHIFEKASKSIILFGIIVQRVKLVC